VGYAGSNPLTNELIRYRVDEAHHVVNPNAFTIGLRAWTDWDFNDILTRPKIFIKFFDTGPTSTSLETFLAAIATGADGQLYFEVNIANTGVGAPPNQAKHLLQVPLTDLSLWKKGAFNDVAIRGAFYRCLDVRVNDTWLDLTAPGVVDDFEAGDAWQPSQGLYYGMDRDFDCALNGYIRVFASKLSLASRGSVVRYFQQLNTDGAGFRMAA